jgi:hypothetical protein
MSRQWTLAIAELNRDRILDWLRKKPYFGNEHDGVFDLALGCAGGRVLDLKPYQREDCEEFWGIKASVNIWFNPTREGPGCDSQGAIYRLAFDALADFSHDLVFHVLDIGILLRKGGRIIVNPEVFQLNELNRMLEPPFWLASQPCHLLKRE